MYYYNINKLIEIKCKYREAKEKKLYAKLYNKFKPKITKDLYENNYAKIEFQIKQEIGEIINNEINKVKLSEIENIKVRIDEYVNLKGEEVEIRLVAKYKNQYEEKLQSDIERREKEYKLKY